MGARHPFASDPRAPGALMALLAVGGAGLLLGVVAAVNGFPLIWADTRAYFMAGMTAIEQGVPILTNLLMDPGGSAAEAGAVEDTVRDVAAIRSAYYGALVYALNALHSLWLVVIAQGLVASYVVFLFCRLTVGSRATPVFLATILVLTLFTSLPWYTAQIMPDVFAGVTILCVALLAFYGDRMSWPEALTLAAILLASLTFHNTHLLTAAGLLVVVAAVKLLERRPPREVVATGVWLATPVAAAVAAGLLVGYVGFGEPSLTPQKPPILLARSVADGPGRAYLEQNCHALDYAICDFVDRLPSDSETFLWSVRKGVYAGASPEVRDRLRAEELAVVAAAVREHPLWQARASMTNWLTQLGLFGIMDMRLRGRAEVDGEGLVASWEENRAGDEDRLLGAFSVLHYLAVGLSLVALGRYAPWWTDGRRAALRGLIVVAAAGLLINAFLCGVLAVPTQRYQSRVIWLLPLLVVPLIVAAARERRRHAAPQHRARTGGSPLKEYLWPITDEGEVAQHHPVNAPADAGTRVGGRAR